MISPIHSTCAGVVLFVLRCFKCTSAAIRLWLLLLSPYWLYPWDLLSVLCSLPSHSRTATCFWPYHSCSLHMLQLSLLLFIFVSRQTHNWLLSLANPLTVLASWVQHLLLHLQWNPVVFAVVYFTWSIACWAIIRTVINIYMVLISKCYFYPLELDWR